MLLKLALPGVCRERKKATPVCSSGLSSISGEFALARFGGGAQKRQYLVSTTPPPQFIKSLNTSGSIPIEGPSQAEDVVALATPVIEVPGLESEIQAGQDGVLVRLANF